MRLPSDVYDEAPEVMFKDELMMMIIDEKNSYKQAATEVKWRDTMRTKIESIEQNDTWKLTELHPYHKEIGLKWVFNLKRDDGGKVINHKARLVAKGYVQQHGVDYEEVFSLLLDSRV